MRVEVRDGWECCFGRALPLNSSIIILVLNRCERSLWAREHRSPGAGMYVWLELTWPDKKKVAYAPCMPCFRSNGGGTVITFHSLRCMLGVGRGESEWRNLPVLSRSLFWARWYMNSTSFNPGHSSLRLVLMSSLCRRVMRDGLPSLISYSS